MRCPAAADTTATPVLSGRQGQPWGTRRTAQAQRPGSRQVPSAASPEAASLGVASYSYQNSKSWVPPHWHRREMYPGNCSHQLSQ